MAFDFGKFLFSTGKLLSDSFDAANKFCMNAARRADAFWKSPDADTTKEIGGWIIDNPGKALRTAALVLFIGQSVTNKPKSTELVPGLIEGSIISAKKDIDSAGNPLGLENTTDKLGVAISTGVVVVSSEVLALANSIQKTNPKEFEQKLQQNLTNAGAFTRGLVNSWNKGFNPPKPHPKMKHVVNATEAPVTAPVTAVPTPAPAEQ